MNIEMFDNGLTKEDILDQVQHVACRGICMMNGLFAVVHIPVHDIYMFPGGGLEENETIEECVKREVLEETGLNVVVKERTISIKEVFENDIWTNHYHLCEIVSQTDQKQLTMEEKELELETKWMSKDELLDVLSNCMGNHPHAPNIHQREFIAFINSI